MLNERGGLIKKLKDYWLGPKRGQAYVESELQLMSNTRQPSAFELGSNAAAKQMEIDATLNRRSNISQ